MSELINLPFIGRDLKTGKERIIGIVRSVQGDIFDIMIWNKDNTLWTGYNENGQMVEVGIDTRF